MKRQTIFLLGVLGLGLFCCKTPAEVIEQNSNSIALRKNTAATDLNLQTPINSSGKSELEKLFYEDKKYLLLQDEDHRFKDNAPFVELMDNGHKERLWFSSSRADKNYSNFKATNHYQQIYYCDREVNNGHSPYEGWGEVKPLELSSDNPFFEDFYTRFNSASKGAVSIAEGKLIFSCDQISEGGNPEFRDLWEIEIGEEGFSNPKPIVSLSNETSWESQPALSSNGKHIFFVSNRKVDERGAIDNSTSSNAYHLFYSFNSDGIWSEPVLVSEIDTNGNELTPSIKYDDKVLYFSSNKEGDYNIYQVNLELNDEHGGYTFDLNSLKLFGDDVINVFADQPAKVKVNDTFDQMYPHFYFNPQNKKVPRAIFWASNDTSGFGSYDLYGCGVPYVIDYQVKLVDTYGDVHFEEVVDPVIKITGHIEEQVESTNYQKCFYAGLKYGIQGGSYASPENGTFHCNVDQEYIFVGYSKISGNNPRNRFLHSTLLRGAEVNSELCKEESLRYFTSLSDTVVFDTIYITKAWQKKPFCPGKLVIEPKHRSIPYFQTGYWEVNTTENLKRDLKMLHEGFTVEKTNDYYHPFDRITRERSDYRAYAWEAPMFPIKPEDNHTYSIANARWIELHPNNLYWGDRPGFSANREERMEGRKERIEQYITYAQKVDENLKNLVDTIQNKYIDLLLQHKEHKPKLLIEIFAVSDNREVLRGWYIGDTVAFRGSDYLENEDRFVTEQVKIIPPDVDEKTKTIRRIEPCSIHLNEDGNNGSKLGLSMEKTDLNTNLSRLRAWYGYKEVYKQLLKSERFQSYLQKGKVALPDNNLSYDDADIIIITRGKREDGDVRSPDNPYPHANNPTGNGYYDYDAIRRIEIQTRLLFDDEAEVEKDYCCDPSMN